MSSSVFSTPRVEALSQKIKSFVARELLPLEANHAKRSWKETFEILDEKREKVKQESLWGLHLPKDEGGLGLSLCEFGQLSEILAQAPFYGHYTFNCQAPDIGNMELLSSFGSAWQKSEFLHPLLTGATRSCFSMTEPNRAGSNPTLLDTTAVKEGDNFIINGHKWFSSGAEGAAFTIVMAVTQPNAPLHERASLIIVPMQHQGVEFIRNIPVFGEEGYGWASHAELKFNHCVVPQSYLIGEEGKGFALAQARLGPGRIHHCMRWIGIAEKALQMMCERAIKRQINEKQNLSDKQLIQSYIAKSSIQIQAARLMTLNTAHEIDQKGAKAAKEAISAIKYFTANMMLEVVDFAIQVHGAMGVTDDTILSAIYRHERGARIWDGADEVHLQSIAKNLLRKYKTEFVPS